MLQYRRKAQEHALNDFTKSMYEAIIDVAVRQEHIGNWRDCRVVVKRDSPKTFETEGFVKTVVPAPAVFGTGSSIVYTNNVVEIMQRQIAAISSYDDIIHVEVRQENIRNWKDSRIVLYSV